MLLRDMLSLMIPCLNLVAVKGHAVKGHAVKGHAVKGHAVKGHAVKGHAVPYDPLLKSCCC
jgi:hypothetical protein